MSHHFAAQRNKMEHGFKISREENHAEVSVDMTI